MRKPETFLLNWEILEQILQNMATELYNNHEMEG